MTRFTGGGNMKSNSESKYGPIGYFFTADAFIYYCLPLPMASADEFTCHLGGEASKLLCHVTDFAPC